MISLKRNRMKEKHVRLLRLQDLINFYEYTMHE